MPAVKRGRVAQVKQVKRGRFTQALGRVLEFNYLGNVTK